jgi:hypothetical protein
MFNGCVQTRNDKIKVKRKKLIWPDYKDPSYNAKNLDFLHGERSQTFNIRLTVKKC